MSITRAIIGALFTTSVVLGAVSCGGTGSNNDQGTSFLAFGYFEDGNGDSGDSGELVILAPDGPVLAGEAGGAVLGADGNAVFTYIGLQNRLANQFIRVTRIDCSYNIPGSSLVIPDDSFNSAAVISATPTADDRDDLTGSSVPLPTDEGSTLYMQFEVVSPDIMSYINVNRNSLPELPFRLNVSCRAVGVTQAGDTLVTNDLIYFVRFFDQAECCTGVPTENVGDDGGFQQGTGTGGDFVGSGGDAGAITEGLTTGDEETTTP